MFDLAKFTKDPEMRKVLLLLGVFTAGLVAVHYWNQIKLTKLRIEKYEEAEEKS
jgi:hypothetical protein